jgi:ATP-binding cassette subfamily B protein
MAGIQGGITAIVANLGRVHEAMLLFEHYRFVVEAEPDLPVRAAPGRAAPANAGEAVPPLRRGIELRDVWFRYGESLPWTLRGVNLTIPAGATTALVGRNGAGKSTVVKLLCRFYDPTRGSIEWDGIDMRELPVEQLRQRIGAVFQDFMQYEFSAADNIGVGDLTALGDRARIEAAARLAGSHEALAALPNGYDTLLTRVYLDAADRDDSRTGVVLSGGQWQRLALARALLRECDLLILDEPASGLDAEAEEQLRTRLAQHRAGRSSLLISHRLSTIRDADTVVVLAGGAVAERGSHADLIEAEGLYSRLFRLQADGYRMVDREGRPQPA